MVDWVNMLAFELELKQRVEDFYSIPESFDADDPATQRFFKEFPDFENAFEAMVNNRARELKEEGKYTSAEQAEEKIESLITPIQNSTTMDLDSFDQRAGIRYLITLPRVTAKNEIPQLVEIYALQIESARLDDQD